jgi:hypothetical protein
MRRRGASILPNTMTDPLPADRRQALQALATLAVAGTAVDAPAADDIPQPGRVMLAPSPGARTPGKPGDYDFLTGRWTIRHQRQRKPGDWDRFEGEATCYSILGGVCHVEELLIPARNFSGMGLRLLDVKQRLWSDHWVNAASGVLVPPGMNGSFEDGAGLFESDDEDDGRPIKVRGVWDLITPRSCRWQQGVSRDGGKTWEVNWSMDWVRKA